MNDRASIVVIGAGAAGLFAAIWAGRELRAMGSSERVLALDGAKSIGAKILVAGGGRCNVTHDAVSETAFAGSSSNAIRKVLRRFDVPRTVEFFSNSGVTLRREETGKLFPTTDRARTVLDALVRAADAAGATLVHPWRVARVESDAAGFLLHAAPPSAGPPSSPVRTRRIILATGGKSLPKTGSDGQGYSIALALGHSLTGSVFPALVPLTVDPALTFIPRLSGLTHTCTVSVLSGSGKRRASFTDSLLCAHFGLSGPAVLDISRYFIDAKRADSRARLVINWTPGRAFESVDTYLGGNSRVSVGRRLGELLPERLARALCEQCGVDSAAKVSGLKREERRALAHAVTAMDIPVIGDRGFAHAEVTAGGVPLRELRLETMESRACPGLHLCGEICDVDGRIGGFNFQWAWASGYVAGISAARALSDSVTGSAHRQP